MDIPDRVLRLLPAATKNQETDTVYESDGTPIDGESTEDAAELDFVVDQMQPGEVKMVEPDEAPGQMLDQVLNARRVFPKGAVVGDGTPGPGRRPLAIDEQVVRAMATVGGTLEEIADFCNCSPDVIKRRFGDIVRQARAGRKLKLRQAQHNLAMSGSVGMQIWLGKQELGQRDITHLNIGDLSRFSDAELAQIAEGKIPGSLMAGPKDEEVG